MATSVSEDSGMQEVVTVCCNTIQSLGHEMLRPLLQSPLEGPERLAAHRERGSNRK
jgi:hypothetical protein